MNIEILKNEAYEIFSGFSRPEIFQDNYENDPESEDHERTLQKYKRHTLSLSAVGSIGYNPISSINPQGMAYYMPRLIELALDLKNITKSEDEPYLWNFILQIMPYDNDKRFSLFEREHKDFICKILNFIKSTYSTYIENYCFENEVTECFNKWCVSKE